MGMTVGMSVSPIADMCRRVGRAAVTAICIPLLFGGCGSLLKQDQDVIGFDLSGIGTDGLEGPPDGRRAVDYEFCVPARASYVREVQIIDPTAQPYAESRGRIRCRAWETLMVGNTHHVLWRESLERLAALRYVKRIERSVFE
jgi:hypothetical protein